MDQTLMHLIHFVNIYFQTTIVRTRQVLFDAVLVLN
jgi:hypothetical protein